MFGNYDISLLQLLLFWKNTVNLKECETATAPFMIEKEPFVELTQYLWKQGWLQVLISKKHSTFENTRSVQVASWKNDSTTQIYGSKYSFEITIRHK